MTKLVGKMEDSGLQINVEMLAAGPKGEKGEKGEKGDKGEQGPPGLDGKSLEFYWNGTQLGIRKEGETTYQYVDLKGEKGDKGDNGEDGYTPIKGIDYFDGKDGKSLEFHWNGTQLGVRVEGETTYQYVNLKGDKGEQGERGIQGLAGKNLEFHWNGTQLGVRQEGQTSYTYVDLKGEQGEPGYTPIKGIDYFDGEKGEKGDPGVDGKSIEFTWSGTQLGVRQEGQSQYQFVDLKGDKGDKGDTGERGPQGIQGPSGKSLEFTWNGTQLGVRQEGQSSYQYVNLKGEKGDKGDKGDKGEPGNIENLTSQHVITALGYSPISPTQLNSKVQTDVPVNAKFTDTVTTINGKTGAISKDDIVALGIPAQDTTYSEITTAEIDTGTASTLRTITGRRVKYILDKVQGWIGGLTKSDVGLGNVDNVKQASKTEFDEHNNDDTRHITGVERTKWNTVDNKVNKEAGKGLSTNDYTTAEKNKLAGIEDGANNYTHPTSHPASMITESSTKRFVSDAQISEWDSKETTTGSQAKADQAEQNAKVYADIVANTAETNAKNYADNKIDDLAGAGWTTETVKEVADDLVSHKANTANPHNVTKSQVGLVNVDNVKQASKTEFDSHNNDTTRHITTQERTRWNNKAEVSQIPTKVSQLENDRGYVTQEELGDAGYGDMLKSIYDTNNDGIVDAAETVIGNEIQLGSYKLVYNSTTNSLDIEVVA